MNICKYWILAVLMSLVSPTRTAEETPSLMNLPEQELLEVTKRVPYGEIPSLMRTFKGMKTSLAETFKKRTDLTKYWMQSRYIRRDLSSHELHNGGQVITIAFSPDGNFFATGTTDGTIRIWTIAGIFRGANAFQNLKKNNEWVISIAFTSDNKLTSISGDKTVRIWNIYNGTITRQFKIDALGETAVFSRNGNLLASGFGFGDSSIRIWDTETGKQIIRMAGHTHRITSLAFSRDGNSIVSGSVDNTIRLWNVATGKQENVMRLASTVEKVRYSPDDGFIAYGLGNGTIGLWNLLRDTKREIFKNAAHPVNALAFSSDETLFASDDDKSLHIWNVESGKEIRKITDPRPRNQFSCIAFSPDGKQLAAGSWDGTVTLWWTTTRQ